MTDPLKLEGPITVCPRLIGGLEVTEKEDKQIIAVDVKRPGGWIDSDPDDFQNVLTNRSINRVALLKWVKSNLVDGTDFGVIKNKKSLWKPGAEKIVGMLGLQVRWPDLNAELNRMRDGAEVIWLSCELIANGEVQAQGAGSRRLSQDAGDGNKAIKMAKKSAMIDAVLNIAGLSEVFTQDLEDELDVATLSEEQQNELHALAESLFEDRADDVLHSLARRRFHFDDGDWTKIPAYRLPDAVRSLTDKAEDEATRHGEPS